MLAAVRGGEVSESVIDDKVRRILRPLIGMGQLENPVGVAAFPVDAHHDVARRVAEASMVLLRNDGILPLQDPHKVALIGPDVDVVGAQGGGSSMVRATLGTTPLDGLRHALGDDVEITVAYGSDPVTPGALLPGPDAIPSSFFTTPDGGRGLHAEFWTNTDFSGDPLQARTEGQIELNLGFHNFPGFNAGTPRYEQLPGELNGRISARWTGTLTVPVTGTYRFAITSLGWYSFSLGETTIAGTDDEAAVADVETETVPAAPQPYGAGGSGDIAEPEVHEVALTLVADRPYALRFDYAANDPSQGFLVGAKLRLGWIPPQGVFSPAVTEAASLAAASDVAIVAVRTYEAEAEDRPHLALPNGQDDLIAAVLAANPRTVVVLMTGSPVDVTRWGGEPAALLQAWFPGQAQGDALGRVLTGQAEPGGRLPLTLPTSLAHTPAADPRSYPGVGGQVEYTEGVLVGYRGVDPDGAQPAYAFGHGLGYTTFEYSDLEVADGADEVVATVTATVRNTGGRAGSEVVQVYIGKLPAPVITPARQLAAFAKVHLAPGGSERVTLQIPRRAVSYFDVDTHDWATPSGAVEVLVGSSSRDIRLTATVTVAP